MHVIYQSKWLRMLSGGFKDFFIFSWGHVGIWPAYFALWMTFVFEKWHPQMFSGKTGYTGENPDFSWECWWSVLCFGIATIRWIRNVRFHLNFSDWPSRLETCIPPQKSIGQISDSKQLESSGGSAAYRLYQKKTRRFRKRIHFKWWWLIISYPYYVPGIFPYIIPHRNQRFILGKYTSSSHGWWPGMAFCRPRNKPI